MPHEIRTCGWCYGAGRYAHADKADDRPVVVSCEKCGGKGTVSVYLYARLNGRRA